MLAAGRAPAPAARTYADVGSDRLRRAMGAMGMDPRRSEQWRRLQEPWAESPIDDSTYWSFASNDGMPMELSCAWRRDEAAVRIYVEPLGDLPGAADRRAAGARSTRRLAEVPGTSLVRYDLVEDLFLVPEPPGSFCLLTAMMWGARGGPECKVYLNPQLGDPETVLAEAMSRLGMRAAWSAALDRCPGLLSDCEPIFLALDLADAADARVKLYFRHDRASAPTAEEVGACAATHVPGSAERFCDALMGGDGWGPGKALVTSLAFRSGDPTASAMTCYVPLHPNVDSDESARRRVVRAMELESLDPGGYLAVLDALADRPFELSRAQTYAGHCGGQNPRVSVYFATEARRPEQEGSDGRERAA